MRGPLGTLTGNDPKASNIASLLSFEQKLTPFAQICRTFLVTRMKSNYLEWSEASSYSREPHVIYSIPLPVLSIPEQNARGRAWGEKGAIGR